MVYIIRRREALALGASAAALALARTAAAQTIPTADVARPKWDIEKGASLKLIRPARFVEPDEVIFRANSAKFAKEFGVEVKVDLVGWEDIRQQAAVSANTGAGPDIVIGWAEDPHIYSDKVIELSDVAEYLGKKYGGWLFLGEKYGKKAKTNNWIGLPMGGSGGPLVYRSSAIKEAGFDKVPDDLPGFLKLCQALKKINKPAGFALGNAVGDANGFANWMLWAHGGALVDEDGKVIINSKETLAAINYVKELYPNFVSGTMSWNDISNNRAYSSGELFLTANGVSLYFSLKNDPATKAIAADTEHAPLVKGVAKTAPMSGTILNSMVFKHSKYPNAAKAYLAYMMEAEQYDPWLTGCLGYWSHPLAAYDKSKVWESDPKIAIYRDTMKNQYWTGYKGPITQAAGTVQAEYILVQMFASVASGQATPEAAAKEAERRSKRYYR
ncbi:multiple sugar transport system substrate-binding protein [Enhydrobacter aerosaccus]|uniref:Multiple sugar transport system substrate-binding protein n=1 Tax=Enhydrobacter aerosaccus TaxID=225324 RepID=A0A1T4P5V4_9HYPH|nr:ABC transporter substrate-binding protein [Enhydrobacter aerosaccus]SJZ86308.1 multiple sugar transport system substrate-binding protein [Enhydrobacter aerosaccus]